MSKIQVALKAFAQIAHSESDLRLLALAFFLKHPQEAMDVLTVAHLFPAQAAGPTAVNNEKDEDIVRGIINITVPAIRGWVADSHRVYRKDAQTWLRIAKTVTTNINSSRIAAIRECRQDTKLGLKAAKDLVEYLMYLGEI